MSGYVVYDDTVCRPLVEIGGIKCATNSTSDWIRIIPVGSWDHPVHGKLQITPRIARRIVENYNAGVLGTDVPVEHPNHQDDGQGAFGWVSALEARDDGVWAQFAWTPQGEDAISSGRFRYLSPVLFLHRPWVSPRGERLRYLLTSVSPTNQPFFRYDGANRLEANLDEFVAAGMEDDAEQPLESGCEDGDVESPDDAPYARKDGSSTDEEEESGALTSDADAEDTEEGGSRMEPENKTVVDDVQDAPVTQEAVKASYGGSGAVMADNQVADLRAALEARTNEAEALRASVAALETQVNALQLEAKRAAVLREVDAWTFCHEQRNANGVVVGRTTSVLSPADRELAADIRMALPDDLGAKFADRMASGGFQYVQLGELGGGIAPPDDVDEEIASYTPETQSRIHEFLASHAGATKAQAIKAVLLGDRGLAV